MRRIFGVFAIVVAASAVVAQPHVVLKLIATGFAESAIAVAQAVHEIRPETKIQPKYSTNTGVPGVVAGQP